MKFAVLTDVHGNAAALSAVLEEIDRMGDVERIYCLGDLIGIGPEHNEVLELVTKRHDMRTVSGNHDEAVLALIHGEKYPESYLHAKEHHQWVADTLDPEYVPWLEALPRTLREPFSDSEAYFTHYAYRDEEALIGNEPLASAVDGTEESLPRLFEGEKASLICFGHHHPVQHIEGEGVTYLNPGALGCQPTAVAPYAIVEKRGSGWDVGLLEAPYDDTEFLKKYEERDVPAKALLRRLFHGDRK